MTKTSEFEHRMSSHISQQPWSWADWQHRHHCCCLQSKFDRQPDVTSTPEWLKSVSDCWPFCMGKKSLMIFLFVQTSMPLYSFRWHSFKEWTEATVKNTNCRRELGHTLKFGSLHRVWKIKRIPLAHFSMSNATELCGRLSQKPHLDQEGQRSQG